MDGDGPPASQVLRHPNLWSGKFWGPNTTSALLLPCPAPRTPMSSLRQAPAQTPSSHRHSRSYQAIDTSYLSTPDFHGGESHLSQPQGIPIGKKHWEVGAATWGRHGLVSHLPTEAPAHRSLPHSILTAALGANLTPISHIRGPRRGKALASKAPQPMRGRSRTGRPLKTQTRPPEMRQDKRVIYGGWR